MHYVSRNIFISIIFSFSLINCGGSSGDSNNGNSGDFGVLTLSGADTVNIGTQLVIGNLVYGRVDLVNYANSIVTTDSGTTINAAGSGTPFTPGDINNNFIFIASDIDISMTVTANGSQYRFACSVGGSVFVDCGGLSFDSTSNTAIFTEATVINTDNNNILTINGTINWQ